MDDRWMPMECFGVALLQTLLVASHCVHGLKMAFNFSVGSPHCQFAHIQAITSDTVEAKFGFVSFLFCSSSIKSISN